MYDEFFQSEKMISVLEKIFSELNFDTIDNKEKIQSYLLMLILIIKVELIFLNLINNYILYILK